MADDVNTDPNVEHSLDELRRAQAVLAGEDDPGPEEVHDALREEEEEGYTPAPEEAAAVDEQEDEGDDESSDDETVEDEDLDEEAASRETLTPDLVAERLKVPVDDVYAMMVSFGDEREPVSIGALKDAFMPAEELREGRENLETERRRWGSERDTQEREIMESRREVRMFVDAIGLERIPPEVVESVAARQRRTHARNRELLLEAFPDFHDREKYLAFSEKAGAFLGGRYNFRPSELANIDDYRTFQMVRDHMQLVERFEKLEADLEAARAQLKKARRGRAPVARERKSNGRFAQTREVQQAQDESRAVHTLINRSIEGANR